MKNWKSYKKLHKWPGLIISIVLLWFAFSGIIMNHRELFSGVDFNRRVMPSNYMYKNWNNAALKGNLIIGSDSILVYGNIGIWLTDSTFKNYSSFYEGFPKGVDNRKIFDMLITKNGDLYAASFSGLYGYDRVQKRWQRFNTNDKESRFTALECNGDTIFALNRSHLFTGISKGINTRFEIRELLPPPGYDHKITLFQTIWQIHSGEIFGVPGKVYVDLLGLITIFLSVTGIIWFFFPGWIKRRTKKNLDASTLVKTGRWSLRWHNKTGAWTFAVLILLFFTGMFLRPPLLIAIGESRVLPIKYSNLDQPNPWYDKMRDILYDDERKNILLATSEGIYSIEPGSNEPHLLASQPPVSVMGITVFKKFRDGYYLIGSFSGLFAWNPDKNQVFDFITGQPYQETRTGRPVGDYKITGMITDTKGNMYIADYGFGVSPLGNANRFPEMPDQMVRDSKISMWNMCLEIHTGRIFEKIIGDFYILIVPLAGIAGIIVVFSGYILWRRKYRKKGYDNIYNN